MHASLWTASIAYNGCSVVFRKTFTLWSRLVRQRGRTTRISYRWSQATKLVSSSAAADKHRRNPCNDILFRTFSASDTYWNDLLIWLRDACQIVKFDSGNFENVVFTCCVYSHNDNYDTRFACVRLKYLIQFIQIIMVKNYTIPVGARSL